MPECAAAEGWGGGATAGTVATNGWRGRRSHWGRGWGNRDFVSHRNVVGIQRQVVAEL